MRFVFTNPNFLPLRTGPARVSEALAREAARRGHRVTVLTTTPSTDPEPKADYEVVRLPGAKGPLSANRLAQDWLSKEAPDAVLVHEVRNDLARAAYRWAAHGRGRLGVLPHGGLTAIHHLPSVLQRLPYALADLVSDTLPRNSTVFGACQQEAADLRAALGRGAEVHCAYLGTDFSPAQARSPSPSPPRLLMAGNLGDVRDPRWFAQAISQLRAKSLAVEAVVAGPMQRQSRFAPAPATFSAPGVAYRGSLAPQQLAAELAGADLFVYPSRYESFGLPVLEAAVSGLPVVTTAHGIAKELDLEACGAYAHSHRAPDITFALERTLARLAHFKEVARRRASGLASWANWQRRAPAYLSWLEGGEVPVPDPPPV